MLSNQAIIESFVLCSTILIGLVAYKRLEVFFRLILIQVIVWFCFYWSLHFITLHQARNGLPLNNQWLMNIHLMIEAGILYMAAFHNGKDKMIRWSVLGSASLFFVVVLFQLFQMGLRKYWHYVDLIECVSITFIFIQIIFKNVKNRTEFWYQSPELIISLGLLLYFGGSVPYISMLHYLQENNPELNALLFKLINSFLSNFRYMLMGYAFWLIYRNKNTLIPTV